jgi:hypothetical protein
MLQDCFEIINPLWPRTGLVCRVASNLLYEIVNGVTFLHGPEAPLAVSRIASQAAVLPAEFSL